MEKLRLNQYKWAASSWHIIYFIIFVNALSRVECMNWAKYMDLVDAHHFNGTMFPRHSKAQRHFVGNVTNLIKEESPEFFEYLKVHRWGFLADQNSQNVTNTSDLGIWNHWDNYRRDKEALIENPLKSAIEYGEKLKDVPSSEPDPYPYSSWTSSDSSSSSSSSSSKSSSSDSKSSDSTSKSSDSNSKSSYTRSKSLKSSTKKSLHSLKSSSSSDSSSINTYSSDDSLLKHTSKL